MKGIGSRVRAKDRSHFPEEEKSSALKQGTDKSLQREM